MTPQEAIGELERFIEYTKTIPDDIHEYAISLEAILYYQDLSLHLRHNKFVDCFPEFIAEGYTGSSVRLRAELDGCEVFCLYPVTEFVKRFGHERLPCDQSY